MIEQNMGGNVLPIFKSFTELEQDQQEIMSTFAAEWTEAYRLFDVAQAKIAKTESTPGAEPPQPSLHLTKIMASMQQVALSDSFKKLAGEAVEALREIKAGAGTVAAELRVVKLKAEANRDLVDRLKVAIKKRNEAIYGNNEVAKRSARFATAHSRRYYGPAATVLPIDRK